MKKGGNLKTHRFCLLVALLLTGQMTAWASGSAKPQQQGSAKPLQLESKRPLQQDTVAVDKTALDCCIDSTDTNKESDYDKLIKQGGSKMDGMFTVRHIKDNWYLEVPDSILGRMMLAVTRFASVPQGFKLLSGEEVNRSVIYLEQYGDRRLLMREYVQSLFARPGDRIAISLQQSVSDPIVNSFDVIGRNPETRAQLIDITKWVLSDNKITSLTASDRTVVGVGNVQADRTFIDTLKTYPINLEIRTLRTYAMSGSKVPAAQSGFATMMLNTSFVLLPPEPMQPRLFDNRVGYFNNKITRFVDDDAPESDAIVSRFRLEPKDPKAYKAGRLVEPKRPIVFYIDPATPKKWVKYLKLGIEDWNVAFEAAGFKNAIKAKDWPTDDPTISMDDARFNVLRYLPSETENAYGPRIVDPRSGEIIDAHICWYHNVMSLVRKWYMRMCGPLDKRAQSMDFPDELMGQLIRFVSSHEVGHSLGLRHNMIASSATPVEKLRDKAWVEQHGHTSSIMDYARFNYVAQPQDKIGERGLFPRINDYDCWAIKWGYQWRPEFKDAYDEKEVLRSEVTKRLTGNRRLWWSGDEGKGTDPRSQAEDLGDNNMTASDYGIENLKRIMQHLREWTAQPDGQYDDLSEMHKSVRVQFMRYVDHVQKNIGGKYTNNAPGVPPHDYMPRALQRQAIAWMGRQLFHAPLWLYPQDIIQLLGTDAYDEIQQRQQTVLTLMLSPGMVYNMHKNAQSSSDPYPADEYLRDVFATVWNGTEDAEKTEGTETAQQQNFRRQLQRTYVQLLGRCLNPTTDDNKGSIFTTAQRSDAILYVEQHLDDVEQYLQRQSATGFTGRHYQQLLREIKKIREKYESGK